jgi:hypothetical protein
LPVSLDGGCPCYPAHRDQRREHRPEQRCRPSHLSPAFSRGRTERVLRA